MNEIQSPQTAGGFLGAAGAVTTSVAEVQASARAEIEAAHVIAKRFPRDEKRAFVRIMSACQRHSLAAAATYKYPRGGQSVEGPSIRLAETLAQAWGNMRFGFRERERRAKESVMVAVAVDLETNVTVEQEFTVSHRRDTKQGAKDLADERDIYELTANMGSRRLRACILRLIPGDIVDAALAECEKTLLSGEGGKSLQDRIRDMLLAFVPLGVTQEMIEARVGHKAAALSVAQVVDLGKIFTSIRDGFATREHWFPNTGAEQGSSPVPSSSTSTPPAPVAAPVAAPVPVPSSSSSASVADEIDFGDDEPSPAPVAEQLVADDLDTMGKITAIIEAFENVEISPRSYLSFLRNNNYLFGAGSNFRSATPDQIDKIYAELQAIIDALSMGKK